MIIEMTALAEIFTVGVSGLFAGVLLLVGAWSLFRGLMS